MGSAITGVTTTSTGGSSRMEFRFECLTDAATTTTPVLMTTLNTGIGNAITGVTTTSAGGQFAAGIQVQIGMPHGQRHLTPVVNSVTASNSGASASTSSLGCGDNAVANGKLRCFGACCTTGSSTTPWQLALAAASGKCSAIGQGAHATADRTTAIGQKCR
jgi:hypothetical protein